MRPALFLALLLGAASLALAQADRGTQLDRATEEVIAAREALREAEERREQGVEPLPGERPGIAGEPGKARRSRLSDEYFARQQRLEDDVARARARYDAALQRWRELK